MRAQRVGRTLNAAVEPEKRKLDYGRRRRACRPPNLHQSLAPAGVASDSCSCFWRKHMLCEDKTLTLQGSGKVSKLMTRRTSQRLHLRQVVWHQPGDGLAAHFGLQTKCPASEIMRTDGSCQIDKEKSISPQKTAKHQSAALPAQRSKDCAKEDGQGLGQDTLCHHNLTGCVQTLPRNAHMNTATRCAHTDPFCVHNKSPPFESSWAGTGTTMMEPCTNHEIHVWPASKPIKILFGSQPALTCQIVLSTGMSCSQQHKSLENSSN